MKIINYKDTKNKKALLIFQDNIFYEFNCLLEELCESDYLQYKRSALISYWLNDYKNYLSNEDKFSPQKLVKYKRGTIIKVNLGFNLGHEQGGLHYCVVLNKKDSIYQTLLNVVPLSSIKDKDKKLHYTNVNLGNEIYDSLHVKSEKKSSIFESYIRNTELMLDISGSLLSLLSIANSKDKETVNSNYILNKSNIDNLIIDFNDILNSDSWNDEYVNSMFEELKVIPINSIDNADNLLNLIRKYTRIVNQLLPILKKQKTNNEKITNEINKMKSGSIALVNQITTISKMRIYSPKTTDDALFDIKLSNNSLTLIDNKIKELFTY